MIYCSNENIVCWKRKTMLWLYYKKLFYYLLNNNSLIVATSCFVKQFSFDCCNNDLTLNNNFYILKSFFLYLFFMLLILINLYLYDLFLCWSWQFSLNLNNNICYDSDRLIISRNVRTIWLINFLNIWKMFRKFWLIKYRRYCREH